MIFNLFQTINHSLLYILKMLINLQKILEQTDIFYHIASFLSLKDALNLSLTNKCIKILLEEGCSSNSKLLSYSFEIKDYYLKRKRESINLIYWDVWNIIDQKNKIEPKINFIQFPKLITDIHLFKNIGLTEIAFLRSLHKISSSFPNLRNIYGYDIDENFEHSTEYRKEQIFWKQLFDLKIISENIKNIFIEIKRNSNCSKIENEKMIVIQQNYKTFYTYFFKNTTKITIEYKYKNYNYN